MIRIRFEEREKIGLQYILESLHGCSPFGSERIRRLRFYAPEERAELETELYNVDRAAKAAGELKETYDKVMIALCQIKDIRGSLRRCRELETPDHVELFEIKGYLQRLETIIPLFEQIRAVTDFRGLAFHDPSPALAILDPDNTRSRGFYIPDSATPRLREIRQAKKQLEEQLFHAQTDAEKENLRMQRTRLCAEEDSEETKVRRAMGAALAPLADGLLEDAETLGRLDFIIQKALFAVRYGGILPEITDGELELTDMVNPELCDLLEQKGRALCPRLHRAHARGDGHHGREHGRQVRRHEDGRSERAAAAGGLPRVREACADAAFPQREDALRRPAVHPVGSVRLRLGNRGVPEGAQRG